MYDVVALGELLIDFAPVGADEAGFPVLAARPGGAPGNFLAALSAYGCKTAMLGKVGADAFGRLLVDALDRAGIGTGGVVMDGSVFTTLAFVTLDDHGDRDFSFARKPGADTCLGPEEVNINLINDCRDFHFGALSLTAEPARSATKLAVERARELGKRVSFDPNLRLPLWDDLDEARRWMLWGLERADVVKLGGEEVDFLWHCGPEEGARRLHDLGVRIAFVTLGDKGCLVSGNGFVCRLPSLDGVRPADTTGAGDIFGGAALSRLLNAQKALDALDAQDLEHAAGFATVAAGLSTERPGGMTSVPTLDEVLKRFT